tara:strand:- start:6 stop:302 length:297 start_codon:yes stop_codon:yes gene_type:complete
VKKHEKEALQALNNGDVELAFQKMYKRRVHLTKHHTARTTSPFISVLHATDIAKHLGVFPPAYLIADLSEPGIVTLRIEGDSRSNQTGERKDDTDTWR